MIYYVADRVRYDLVTAANEEEAKAMGALLLPGPILTVRLATQDEIELIAWHNEMVRREEEMRGG